MVVTYQYFVILPLYLIQTHKLPIARDEQGALWCPCPMCYISLIVMHKWLFWCPRSMTL